MENKEKILELISSQKGISEVGYTVLNSIAISKILGIPIFDVDENLNKLIEEKQIFYITNKKPSDIDLESGRIKYQVKTRLYVTKEKYLEDKKKLQDKKIALEMKEYLREGMKLEKILKLSEEALACLSFINLRIKYKSFIEVYPSDVQKIVGINKEMLAEGLKELKENKQIFEVRVPLKKEIKYEKNGMEIVKKYKNLIFTNSDLAALALKQLNNISNLRNEKME